MDKELLDLVRKNKKKISGQISMEDFQFFLRKHRKTLLKLAEAFNIIPPEKIRKKHKKLWEKALVNKEGVSPIIPYLKSLMKSWDKEQSEILQEWMQWKEDFKVYMFNEGVLDWETLLELPSAFKKRTIPGEYRCEVCNATCWSASGAPLAKRDKNLCCTCYDTPDYVLFQDDLVMP